MRDVWYICVYENNTKNNKKTQCSIFYEPNGLSTQYNFVTAEIFCVYDANKKLFSSLHFIAFFVFLLLLFFVVVILFAYFNI